jgi:hypothetical protein
MIPARTGGHVPDLEESSIGGIAEPIDGDGLSVLMPELAAYGYLRKGVNLCLVFDADGNLSEVVNCHFAGGLLELKSWLRFRP